MRLLYVADGRSPIAWAWVDYFAERGHEVHLVSTRPCAPRMRLASLQILPLGPGSRRPPGGSAARSPWKLSLLTAVRHWLGPLAVRRAAPALARVVEELRPDLVHALRIPFEGMLAASAGPRAPLLLSVWGNDFTLHGVSTPWMRAATQRALARADALHADCRRDLRLASTWGLRPGRPTMLLPGNGGVRRELFRPADPRHPERRQMLPGWTSASGLILNPRGFRAYVRTDTFFRALPRVLQAVPGADVAGVAMADDAVASRWVDRLGLQARVRLLPEQEAAGMAALFRAAHVSVSPSVHDGTPNTLLEAMACGCLPVAGDLESIREWIVDGENGLLVDAGNPEAVAGAIVRGLKDDPWRAAAVRRNLQIVEERADFSEGMKRAEAFYRELAS
jgi:glycosyltransferase involved in cell wall biosynthesis